MKNFNKLCLVKFSFWIGVALTGCSNDDVTPEIYDNDSTDGRERCIRLEEGEYLTLTTSQIFYIEGLDSSGSKMTFTIPQGTKILRSVSGKNFSAQLYFSEEDNNIVKTKLPSSDEK